MFEFNNDMLFYILFAFIGFIVGLLVKFGKPYIDKLIDKNIVNEDLKKFMTYLNAIAINAVVKSIEELQLEYKKLSSDGYLSDEDIGKIKALAIQKAKEFIPNIYKESINKLTKGRLEDILTYKFDTVIKELRSKK